MIMVLGTNRELTNETASPKIFIPDIETKHFKREWAQAINSISRNHNLIYKYNDNFTDSKKEKKSAYNSHHCGFNKKTMDIIDKQDKNPETLRLKEKRQKLTKPGNHRFKFESDSNQKM